MRRCAGYWRSGLPWGIAVLCSIAVAIPLDGWDVAEFDLTHDEAPPVPRQVTHIEATDKQLTAADKRCIAILREEWRMGYRFHQSAGVC